MTIREDIVEYLRLGEKKSKNLGVEIEHFVVDSNGIQIGFDEVTGLIDDVVSKHNYKPFITEGHVVGYDTGEYTVTLEPSCQFEVSIYPKNDLEDIKDIYNKFYNEWNTIFEERDFRIITNGNLPAVEEGKIIPDDIPLSSKLRYKYMNQYFEKRGKYGKYMMRASGSTQISIDYSSEEDMIVKTRVLEKISPILMILMENKVKEDSHLPGEEDKTHLLRTQEWENLDDARTGYFPKSFDPDFGYESIADVILNTPLILLNDKGITTYVEDKTAIDLINEGTLDYDICDEKTKTELIEHFISMGFFHYRIKRYIEIRVADAVPIDKALAYAALIKGLMYNDDSIRELDQRLKRVTQIDQINDATQEIEKYGFDAVIYDNKTAQEWSNEIVDIAAKVVDDNERRYLEIFRR